MAEPKETVVNVDEYMEELLPVVFPITRDQQDDVFIRVNQRTWLVKRGEQVMLPRCAVEVYRNAERANLEMIEYIKKKSNG